MKVLLINCVLGYGSTGKIVLDIAKQYEKEGHVVKIAYSRDPIPEDAGKYAVKIGNKADGYLHALYTRITDKHALASKNVTKRFIKWAESFNPDLLWIHNIHGYYINYELLFEWIKTRQNMQVKWTLHDCWSYTGHCAFYDYAGCGKWQNIKEGCKDCPQTKEYPKSYKDNSELNYERKKRAFTGVKNLTIITPSNWLKEEVKKSFLADYPIEVIHNSIDTDTFKHAPNSFKKDHGIEDKKIILGVANVWEKRKGLDEYIELSKRLEEEKTTDNKFKIVLIGLNNKQINQIRNNKVNILGLPKTKSVKELVEAYSAANVFLNLSREDNYPTVNLEAEACGTPVITYNTGGCSETVKRDDSIVIDKSLDEVMKVLCKG